MPDYRGLGNLRLAQAQLDRGPDFTQAHQRGKVYNTPIEQMSPPPTTRNPFQAIQEKLGGLGAKHGIRKLTPKDIQLLQHLQQRNELDRVPNRWNHSTPEGQAFQKELDSLSFGSNYRTDREQMLDNMNPQERENYLNPPEYPNRNPGGLPGLDDTIGGYIRAFKYLKGKMFDKPSEERVQQYQENHPLNKSKNWIMGR